MIHHTVIKDEPVTLVQRYIVCYAPGWPDPHAPTPNTLENALGFCKQHGGKVKTRWESAWKDHVLD